MFLRNTDPVISNLNFYEVVALGKSYNGFAVFFSVLHRIHDQVCDHLPDAEPVRKNKYGFLFLLSLTKGRQ